MTAMILTALALLFAVTLFAGIVMLLDCAVRGLDAYRALNVERARRAQENSVVTITHLIPPTCVTAKADPIPAPLRAAA